MKIKVQHLAPYLPYGLKVRLPFKNEKTCRSYVIGTVGGIYSDGSIVCYDTVNATPNWFKPILKPISEADTEIRTQFQNFHFCKQHDKEVIDLFCEEKIGDIELIQDLKIENLPYDSVQWLLSHHYDVFGLLESGDAVLFT